jgi:hypothetical protein
MEGRIIKVRWDKFQGSAPQASPQLASATLSSPQMLHAQLTPTQTPRPSEYVAVSPQNPSQTQTVWQPQYMSSLRPTPQTLSTQPTLQPSTMTMGTSPTPFGQYVQPQYGQATPSPSGQGQIPPGAIYAGVLFNPGSAGYFHPNYGTPSQLHPLQPTVMAPHVRLPTSSDNAPHQTGYQQPGHSHSSDPSFHEYNTRSQ